MALVRGQPTINDITSSLLSGSVLYEIRGMSAYFGYSTGGSSFFIDKSLQTRIEGPRDDYLRVVRAILRCAEIATINPRSIWMKCRLEESIKVIQIVDIGSTGIALTRKKYTDFLERIEDIQYGHFNIVKNPGIFSYNSKNLDQDLREFVELFPDLDIKIDRLASDLKKRLFQKLEKILLLNGRSKIKNWSTSDSRSILVSTPKGDIKIFRSR